MKVEKAILYSLTSALLLSSCNGENNSNASNDTPTPIVIEESNDYIPESRYIEKRNKNKEVEISWLYNSEGKLSEYSLYNTSDPLNISAIVYSDETQQKIIGRLELSYIRDPVNKTKKLIHEVTYDDDKANILHQTDVEYATNTDGSIIGITKYLEKGSDGKTKEHYNIEYIPTTSNIKKETYYEDETENRPEEQYYYFYKGQSSQIQAEWCRIWDYIDNDDLSDYSRCFYNEYRWSSQISTTLPFQKNTFQLADEAAKLDIENLDEISELEALITTPNDITNYSFDNNGKLAKESLSSFDGKDQSYTIYTYSTYNGELYTQNKLKYSNADEDNSLIEKYEYRMYECNGSDFYEESYYYYNNNYDYKEETTTQENSSRRAATSGLLSGRKIVKNDIPSRLGRR